MTLGTKGGEQLALESRLLSHLNLIRILLCSLAACTQLLITVSISPFGETRTCPLSFGLSRRIPGSYPSDTHLSLEKPKVY